LLPTLKHVHDTTDFPKSLGHARGHCEAHFERLVDANKIIIQEMQLCLLKTSSAAEILIRYRPKRGPETRSKFEFPIRTRKFPVLCHLDEEQAIAVRRSLRHRSPDLDASFAFVDQVRNVGGGLMESPVLPDAKNRAGGNRARGRQPRQGKIGFTRLTRRLTG
jgi:hypothetical protein